jgi:hypothetical protein
MAETKQAAEGQTEGRFDYYDRGVKMYRLKEGWSRYSLRAVRVSFVGRSFWLFEEEKRRCWALEQVRLQRGDWAVARISLMAAETHSGKLRHLLIA